MATRNVTRKRKSNGRKITQGGRSHGKHGVCRAEVRKETIGGLPTEVNKRKEKEKKKKKLLEAAKEIANVVSARPLVLGFMAFLYRGAGSAASKTEGGCK